MQDAITGNVPKAGTEPVASAQPAKQAAQKQTRKETGGKRIAAADRAAENARTSEPKQMTLDELQDMLSKLNLTFDLFEIAAEYTVDEEANRIKVVVRNTRTGKVIRRIPPKAFLAEFYEMMRGLGTLINSSA